jgi:hypothetical protein
MGSSMTYVSSLRQKRQEVWNQLETLRGEQRRIADRLGIKEAQLKNIDELLAMEGETSAPKGLGESLPAASTFLDAAAEVIRDGGSGVHYKGLLEQLNKHGVNVPGRDPAANLLAHLGRDERFVRVGRGTYGLKGTHKEMRSRRRTTRKRVRRTKAAGS